MFKDVLKYLRKKNKVSQQELAEVLKISPKTVASWEMGRTSPDYATLSKIAEYYNVNISYLLKDGIFQRRDLVLKLREPITQDLREFVGDEIVDYAETLTQ